MQKITPTEHFNFVEYNIASEADREKLTCPEAFKGHVTQGNDSYFKFVLNLAKFGIAEFDYDDVRELKQSLKKWFADNRIRKLTAIHIERFASLQHQLLMLAKLRQTMKIDGQLN